ncbi:MAG: hypothetical protein LUD51_06150 [Clostridia bacterium]|nr:hypothetical protein [Clostridia bacterium]
MSNDIVPISAGTIESITARNKGVDILKPLKKDIYLKDLYLYNVGKRASEVAIASVKEGDEVILRHEKTLYDEFMTICYTKSGLSLGEVGEFDEEIFSRILDAGKELYCQVVRKGLAHDEPFVRISVTMKDY